MLENVYSRIELTPETEIVAAMVEAVITNNAEYIQNAMKQGQEVTLLTRQEMQFMSACDLDPKWSKLADGPTLIKF